MKLKGMPNKSNFGSISLTVIWSAIISLTFLSCTGETNRPAEEQILAQIGDDVITVDEFRYNYEFGFAHLKKGKDRKRAYLEYMIKEKVLALEGYKLGLDKSKHVQTQEQKLLNELLVEALFEKEVKDKIKVTQAEIREAINKSKISFKLRYWMEPSLEEAIVVRDAMRQVGYAKVVGEILRNNPEIKIDPKKFETEYITYMEVEPELLDKIKDLPIGEISDPIESGGKYGIFQMLDIRRAALFESEYSSKATRFEQIIFHGKLQAEAKNYVTNFMTSKEVLTKGDAFGLLGKAIIEWQNLKKEEQGNFNVAVQSASEGQPAMKSLKDDMNQTFMVSNEGSLSIREFLDHFDVGSIETEDKSNKTFRDSLIDAVALSIRNYFLVKEAIARNLKQSTKVQNELKQWRDKWVYEETRRHFTGDIKLESEQVRDYFESHKERYKIRKNDQPTFSEFAVLAQRHAYKLKVDSVLNKQVENLKMSYRVRINYAVLDTITVTDFKKSRWATMQVYKLGTNRPAVAYVDPAWGY